MKPQTTTPASVNEEPQLTKAGGGTFGIPKPAPKPVEIKKEDTKKMERANALFAGIGSSSKDKKADSSDSEDDKKKKKKDKKKEEESKGGDLLALDGGVSSTTATNGGANIMDLLDFDAKPQTTSTVPNT